MLFFVIIFIIVAVGATISKKIAESEEGKMWSGWLAKLAWILVAIFLFLSCIRIIPPGHVGVAVTLGYISEKPLKPGLNLVWPITTVHKMDVRTRAYTMSKVDVEGQKRGDDAIDVLSSDGLTLKLDITVWFRLVASEAPRVYRTIGVDYVDKIVRPAIRAAFRDAAVRVLSVDIYSERREMYVGDVAKMIESQFQDRGVVLEKVLLRNVDLPQTVRQAIEDKLAMEHEAKKMVFVLQKEKQEAERKRVEASGIADAQKIIAKDLTQQYLTWLWMNKIEAFGTGPNNAILVLPYDQKLTPLIQVPGATK